MSKISGPRSLGSNLQGLQAKRLQSLDRYFARSGLALKGKGKGTVAAWFLGPKAENKKLLRALVLRAIDRHCDARHAFHPKDPKAITAKDKASNAYRNSIKALEKHADALFEALQLSAPIWSMRHQGHMLWDQVIPAIAGYFGAMLYNQNNVAVEASPLTTRLEIEVGNDLCRLLGFQIPENSTERSAWGHITCDGSVANIESLWAARNIKFFPHALRAALQHEPTLASATNIEVTCLSGRRARLIDLDDWQLLNLELDHIIELLARIELEYGIKEQITTAALQQYAIPNIGWIDFYHRYLPGIAPPIAIAPATCHYSWPKAGTLLGLGQNNIHRIAVDLDARMEIDALRQKLSDCLSNKIPIISVVAVIGSTEESAVDPLREIIDLRKEFHANGLTFVLHCDAAWGGYFASLRRPDTTKDLIEDIPSLALSPYVNKQLNALKDADSITIDPHKAGYVPYPAGALCYRNAAMRDFVSLRAPVVFHSQSEQTVGIYGIEGSKPGAAAAGVYLAHKVIRPDRKGYGKILGQCLWTSTRLYCRLVTMDDPCFKIVLFQRLPSERNNEGPGSIEAERAYIRENFVGKTNAQLRRLLREDPEAKKRFSELGSDLVILAYSFNYVDQTGEFNRDPKKLAMLNTEIFNICSTMIPDPNLNSKPLIVTRSSFSVAGYGREFVQHYCDRLGVGMQDEVEIPFLISTTMDPWTTETSKGNFLKVIETALRGAVHQAIIKVQSQQRQHHWV